MKPTIRITGTAEIARKLDAMGKALTRKTLLPVLRKNVQPIAEDMRARAPQDSGALAKSVRVSTRLSQRQRSQSERIAPVEIHAGPGPLPQAVQVEFGNDHQAPQPFIRPAFDSAAGRALDGIAKDGIAAIMDAARKG